MTGVTVYPEGLRWLRVGVALVLTTCSWLQCVTCMFHPISSSFPAIGVDVTADPTYSCEANPSCWDTVTNADCGQLGVCTLKCPSGSRQNWPDSKSILRDCTGIVFPTPPEGAIGNGTFLANATENTRCAFNTTVPASTEDTFSISLWLKGECNTSCTFLRLMDETGAINLKLGLGGSALSVNNRTSALPSSSSWTHVLLTKRTGGDLELYLGNIRQNVSLPISNNVGGSTIIVESESDLTGSDFVMLLDGRFLSDRLTQREITQLYTGGTFETATHLTSCRCPLSHPDILSSDDSQCVQLTNSANRVPRLQKVFNPPSVTLNKSVGKAWAANSAGDVIVTVHLGSTFQVNSVTVTFRDPPATVVSVRFNYSGILTSIDTTGSYTCNTSSCSINSEDFTTYQEFEKALASDIELTLGRSSGGGPLVVLEITVAGKCNCHGNAASCTTPPDPQTYICSCQNDTQSKGDSCETCLNNYYRKEAEFGCVYSCACHSHGVTLDKCEQVDGKCICKSNVEGSLCDTCQRLAYNLTETNTDGCMKSACHANGSAYSNNQTGQCHCRPNVTGSNCDTCFPEHYGINSGQGCSPCGCYKPGTSDASPECEAETGQCQCKVNVKGHKCSQCLDTFYDLQGTSANGCKPCNCHKIGTMDFVCNKTSGQCTCRSGDYHSRTCTPHVNETVPQYGPLVGQTRVTITGRYLNSPEHAPSVAIGSIPQTLFSYTNDTMLVFSTKNASASANNLDFVLSWADSNTTINLGTFAYKPNPSLSRSDIPSAATSSISGGCSLRLAGNNLDSVFQPKLVARVAEMAGEMQSVCKHLEGGSILCPTPNMTGSSTSASVLVDLILDGIRETNITQLTLNDDPEFGPPLDFVFRPPFEKTLIIKGSGFTKGCTKSDYAVWIGPGRCNILSFSENSIKCELPQEPPLSQQVSERRYNIVVHIGSREVKVGEIYYQEFWKTPYFVYILLGAAFLLLLVLAVCIACCCCRCRNRRRRRMNANVDSKSNPTFASGQDVGLINTQASSSALRINNAAYEPHIPRAYEPPVPTETDVDPMEGEEVVTSEYFLHRVEEGIRRDLKSCLIPQRDFQISAVCLNKGNHVRLMEGSFTARHKTSPNCKLTVKMLKDPLPDKDILSPAHSVALRECLRLVPHLDDNVINMLGIGLDKKRFYIIYPHMENRTLKDHVVNAKKNFVLRQLLEYALQVSYGMEYLSGAGIVHKDLAARNCMLNAAETVKISDAAFSWDLYQSEYMYDSQRDRYLPIRWMAPESMGSGFYDVKSDVWAYGVLMWELLTRGILPFQEIKDDELQAYINDGYRLGKPQMITDELYALLSSCWSTDSEGRPSFGSIQNQVGNTLNSTQSPNDELYINSQPMENTYINVDDIKKMRENMAPPRPPRK